MVYVKISPLTRLEGHLGITASVRNGQVVTAWSHGEMFRGFEKILRKRDPRDAPTITSRTCGVCHFIHRHTSLRNIENATGFSFPAPQAKDLLPTNPGTFAAGAGPTYRIDGNRTWTAQNAGDALGGTPIPVGAQLARNIVHLVTYVYSHAAHLIVLAGPDYWSGIDAKLGSGFAQEVYNEAVVAQRILHEILGVLGGKVPHQMSAIPGGFSQTVNQTVFNTVAALAQKRVPKNGDRANLNAGKYWPLLDLGGGLDAGKTLPLLGAASPAMDWVTHRAVPYILAMVETGVSAGAHNWGVGSGNFVCAPTFDVVQVSPVRILGDAYFRGGVRVGAYGSTSGTLYRLDPTKADPGDSETMTIYEDTTSGKYPNPDEADENDPYGIKYCGGYPGDVKTEPYVAPDPKEEAYDWFKGIGDKYTWYKATRTKDSNGRLYVVESGPLARLVVNDVDPINLRDGSGNITLSIDTDGDRTADTNVTFNLPAAGSGPGKYQSCTLNRLIARAQDTLLLIDMLIGSNYSGQNAAGSYLAEINSNKCWLTRLQQALNALGDPNRDKALSSSVMYSDPPNAWESLGTSSNPAKGCGYWDAPRGITCHFCQVVNGRLIQYQHIAGTTWNGNGRDQWGQPGPFEWSLMNFYMAADLNTEKVGETATGISHTIDDIGAAGGTYWGKSQPSTHDVKVTLKKTPVVERSVKIQFTYLGKTYVIEDIPKCDGSTKGYLWSHEPDAKRGQAWIKDTSYIDYSTGEVYIYFKDAPELPDSDMTGIYNSITVKRYGYIGSNPVPASDFTSGRNVGRPNPINILRTIRSYDPCLACSIHVVDSKGRARKYEIVPVTGWEVE